MHRKRFTRLSNNARFGRLLRRLKRIRRGLRGPTDSLRRRLANLYEPQLELERILFEKVAARLREQQDWPPVGDPP